MNPLARILLFTLLFGVASASAADLREIRESMRERLDAVNALWAADKIGENNQGFIEGRAKLTEAEQAVVDAENADRREVYAIIGRRHGDSPAAVGRARAAMIAQQAAPGLWLQGADGKWYRKPAE